MKDPNSDLTISTLAQVWDPGVCVGAGTWEQSGAILGPHWLYNCECLGMLLCVPSGQGGVPKHHRLRRWISGFVDRMEPPKIMSPITAHSLCISVSSLQLPASSNGILNFPCKFCEPVKIGQFSGTPKVLTLLYPGRPVKLDIGMCHGAPHMLQA